MKSLIVKRSVVIDGHNTSVSVEDAFWGSLKKIAARRRLTMSALLTAIDSDRHYSNLSSAIRLFVLNFYRDQLAEVHRREGIDATINNLPAHGYS
jgi:predicted DNA-binding ribbon-helix-helix protein